MRMIYGVGTASDAIPAAKFLFPPKPTVSPTSLPALGHRSCKPQRTAASSPYQTSLGISPVFVIS